MSTFARTKNIIGSIIDMFKSGRFNINECIEQCMKETSIYTNCIPSHNEKETTKNKLLSYALKRINSVIEYRSHFPGDYIVFINCSGHDFITDIITGKKLYETRTKNTLQALIGKRVYLCETGKGKRLVRCTAIIKEVITIKDRHTWDMYKDYLSIEPETGYDWKDDTKAKYLYKLESVYKLPVPFTPVDGVMHGRSFMDYNG